MIHQDIVRTNVEKLFSWLFSLFKDDTKEDCLVFGAVTNDNLGLPWLILG